MSLTSRFANPAQFIRLADKLLPFLALATLLAFAFGLYYALFDSPADYQQGETVRIIASQTTNGEKTALLISPAIL